MKHDDGILEVYTLTNNSSNGLMPEMTKTLFERHFFKYRTVGYGRYFARSGVNQQVDSVCRIWESRNIRNDMEVLIGKEWYRIIQIQHTEDEDGLRVTDLSLERIDDLDEEES